MTPPGIARSPSVLAPRGAARSRPGGQALRTRQRSAKIPGATSVEFCSCPPKGEPMADEGAVEKEGADGQGGVTFNYVKSPQYRSLYVDGAWGGVTPRGSLAITFYSERFPLPQSITFALGEDGLGEELSRVSRQDVVREVEATAFMDLQAAISLHRWLAEKIPALRKRLGVQVEEESADEKGEDR